MAAKENIFSREKVFINEIGCPDTLGSDLSLFFVVKMFSGVLREIRRSLLGSAWTKRLGIAVLVYRVCRLRVVFEHNDLSMEPEHSSREISRLALPFLSYPQPYSQSPSFCEFCHV